MSKHFWSQDEIKFVEDNIGVLGCGQISKLLGIGRDTVKRKLKTYYDLNENNIPEGFVQLKDYPSWAINKLGSVLNIKTRRVLKQGTDKKGYSLVCLTNKKSCKVHRLVMLTFCPREDSHLLHVNHIDGNKKNNCLDNLEWCTNKENQVHAKATGLLDLRNEKVRLSQTGESNSSGKLKEADILEIYKLSSTMTKSSIAKSFSVQPSQISVILSGKSWKHMYHNYERSQTST